MIKIPKITTFLITFRIFQNIMLNNHDKLSFMNGQEINHLNKVEEI